MTAVHANSAHPGLPVVLSAPSGAGKTTVATRLVGLDSNIRLSISCTTRAPRVGERDGVNYHFLTEPAFRERIAKGDFLEWAEVHGHLYGTPISLLKTELSTGRDVLLTIDPQGGRSVRKVFPDGVFIFLAPPSWETLVSRLTARGTDDRKTLDLRLANARGELGLANEYDYVVVNDNLDDAVADVAAILRAERRRIHRPAVSGLAVLKAGGA